MAGDAFHATGPETENERTQFSYEFLVRPMYVCMYVCGFISRNPYSLSSHEARP